jgi:hypothetical protein
MKSSQLHISVSGARCSILYSKLVTIPKLWPAPFKAHSRSGCSVSEMVIAEPLANTKRAEIRLSARRP